MNVKLARGWIYALPVLLLAAWVLHGFIEAMLASCVVAIASWPLYRAFTARMPR